MDTDPSVSVIDTSTKSSVNHSIVRSSVLWSAVAFWGIVLFWTLELTLVQHFSTDEVGGIDTHVVLKDSLRRGVLNFLCITAILGLTPRKWLPFVFTAFFVFSNLVLAYFYYFGRPLSWLVISGQWSEGVAVADHAIGLVKIPVLLATLGLLGLKCFFVLRFPYGDGKIPYRALGVSSALIYLGSAFIFAGYYKPIQAVRFASPEYTYGYTLAWVTEAICWDNETILKEAKVKAAEGSDRLNGIQKPIEFGERIVVIQVESLDFDAVEAADGSEPIMPFVDSLREQSLYFVVKPFHDVGSAEADFSFLTGCRPHGRVNPYLVEGFDYQVSLPFLAKEAGYRVVAMHGNTGAFYQRRAAYEQMGFDEILFAEELHAEGVDGRWDHELLAHSANLMTEAVDPTIHFLITISSHGPFTKLPPDYPRLYQDAVSLDKHYLNCMRYVDDSLRDYIDSLPVGTTVMIYGDHESDVYGYESKSNWDDMVPWIIYQKGHDLSKDQSIASAVTSFVQEEASVGRPDHSTMASSSESKAVLSHLDLATFVHNHFRSHRSQNLELSSSRSSPIGEGNPRLISHDLNSRNVEGLN